MNSILKHVPKPSDLLFAMIKGLEKQSKRKDFKIDMGTFGDARWVTGNKQICFGCAATCTIQEIAKKKLDPSNIAYLLDRAKLLGFEEGELNQFESWVDLMRRGNDSSIYNSSTIEALEHLYDCSLPEPIENLKPLHTRNWKKNIKAYRAYANQLKRCEL